MNPGPNTPTPAMTQLSKPAVLCPVCEASVCPPVDAMAGEILACDDCGTELELSNLDPMTLIEAPDVAEDWGE
ncbi:MAG: alpha-aminoadipate carrier protein LysW [Planctomycetota bacterium]